MRRSFNRLYLTVSFLIGFMVFISSDFSLIKAQNFPKTNISFGLGPAFAIGDFADTDANNSESGGAKIGIQANIFRISHLFTENFGITGRMTAAKHTIKKNKLLVVPENNPSWKYVTLMVGPNISFHSSNQEMSFDVYLLAGIMNASSPILKFNGLSSRNEKGSALASSFGLSIRNHFSDKFSAFFSTDYTASDVEFGDNSFTQSISAISASIGISARLN